MGIKDKETLYRKENIEMVFMQLLADIDGERTQSVAQKINEVQGKEVVGRDFYQVAQKLKRIQELEEQVN